MTVSILPFDPNPDGTCRACRGALHPETWLCLRCGTAHGERNRCPHCRSIARTLPHPALHHRCSVCGKPRFSPGPVTLSTTDSASMHLSRAGQSQRISVILKILGYAMLALGLPGLLLSVVVLLILMPGPWVSGIALFFAIVPLLLSLWLQNRSTASLLARDQSLEQAYDEAILGVLGAGAGERDAAGIAQAIGLSVERTDRLLARLNADDRMTSRVTDEGELMFGVAEPARMRIADMNVAMNQAPLERPDASQAIVDVELDESAADDRTLHNRT